MYCSDGAGVSEVCIKTAEPGLDLVLPCPSCASWSVEDESGSESVGKPRNWSQLLLLNPTFTVGMKNRWGDREQTGRSKNLRPPLVFQVPSRALYEQNPTGSQLLNKCGLKTPATVCQSLKQSVYGAKRP